LLERKIPSAVVAVVAAVPVVSAAIYAFPIAAVETVLICSSSLLAVSPATVAVIAIIAVPISRSLPAFTQSFLIAALIGYLYALVTVPVAAIVTAIVVTTIVVTAIVTAIAIPIVAVAVLCRNVRCTHEHEAKGHRKGKCQPA
jgi:hypothetical protein